MPFSRIISVMGYHAEGEVGDVIIGGVLKRPRQDHLVLHKPRGRSSMNTNLVLPPCDPRADAGFLIMESDEYTPMSGSNPICTAIVLLEKGMVPMKEPVTEFVSYIRGTTAVGNYPAVLPTVKGRAWITSFKQIVLGSTDPFPTGFRVGDQWHGAERVISSGD